jgi:hypothetical protein
LTIHEIIHSRILHTESQEKKRDKSRRSLII